MRTPRGLLDLVEPSPNRVDHLTFPWSLADTPERLSVPSDALPVARSSRMVSTRLTCEPEDYRFAGPVKVRRARARKRLPSYRDRASRNPHVEPARKLVVYALFRAPIRLLSDSCSASGGASSFLPASALARHEALRPPGGQDARCVQPTSATCTICVYPYSRVPGSLRGFHRVEDPTESGLRATRPGDQVLHDTRARFGGRTLEHASFGLASDPARGFRAWALSSHGARRRRPSDTSVASPSCAETGSPSRDRCRGARVFRCARALQS